MSNVHPIKIYKREAFFIPSSSVKSKIVERLIEDYTFRFYDLKGCNRCEFYEERQSTKGQHLELCDNCGSYSGGASLAKPVTINGKDFISLPVGSQREMGQHLIRKKVISDLDDLVIVDKNPKHKMKRSIKFTGTLKDYQEEAVLAIRKKKRGVINAPPRSGKTVISTAAICRIGGKTLIMASQRDWLVGFYETFCGSKTQKPLTNATGAGTRYNANAKPANVGFCKNLADFKKFDVCLVTYQTFISDKGMRLLRKIRDMFSVFVVDEIHTGAATKYAQVISKLNVRYSIGLSGTPSRKDMRFVLMEHLMGPIIYEAKVERLKPTIVLTHTKYEYKLKSGDWTRMVTNLESNPQRLKLIAQTAIKDAKNGHMILIPLNRVSVIQALTKAINKMANRTIAASFYGGTKKDMKDKIIQQCRTYKLKILVGNTKQISTGINIPRASAIYDVTPSSNIENATQRVSRVLTPYDGDKPPPILRYFLDSFKLRKNCIRNEFFNCVNPKFKPIFHNDDYNKLKNWINSKDQKDYSNQI